MPQSSPPDARLAASWCPEKLSVLPTSQGDIPKTHPATEGGAGKEGGNQGTWFHRF